MTPSSPHSLIRFYDGSGRDGAGRTLADVQALSLEQLEDEHDYIQWLFPLRETSQFNPAAPVADDAVVAAFRSRAGLRDALVDSLRVMLRFYGLAESAPPAGYRIVTGPTFAERSAAWLTRGNHNFLRLTRILKSLSLLGERERAAALLACLTTVFEQHGTTIGATTFSYWTAALD